VEEAEEEVVVEDPEVAAAAEGEAAGRGSGLWRPPTARPSRPARVA